ncbi:MULTISPECIES: hypothetical protein [unclassified Streptomyces]|uniref:hypothetical protein n=1 Tax=unclassified Streptomyces TaxID=2593676 RepID=UPI00036285E9|nr:MULTISPECIES: hypothetical protein [unclassified Streptomyces]MYY03067.1 hypothetical protein [Streptomyces sp. SID4913]
MPKPDSYGQHVQYPVLSDAPNIETALQSLVNGVVPLTTMRFANANERAATLTGSYKPVPGMITYLIAEDRFDRRDGDGVWRPLSPSVWKPLSYATGYTAQSGSPAYRVLNNEVQLRGTFRRTTGAVLTTDAEITFATLPSEARPGGSDYRYFPVAGDWNTTSGKNYFLARVSVTSAGSLIYMMPNDTKCTWLSLDSVRFSID